MVGEKKRESKVVKGRYQMLNNFRINQICRLFIFRHLRLSPLHVIPFQLLIFPEMLTICCTFYKPLSCSDLLVLWFEEVMHSQASQGFIENGKENDITHPPLSPVLQCKQAAQSTAEHNKKG